MKVMYLQRMGIVQLINQLYLSYLVQYKTISQILRVKTNNKQKSKERLKTNLKVQFLLHHEMHIQAEILNSNNLNSKIPRAI